MELPILGIYECMVPKTPKNGPLSKVTFRETIEELGNAEKQTFQLDRAAKTLSSQKWRLHKLNTRCSDSEKRPKKCGSTPTYFLIRRTCLQQCCIVCMLKRLN
ncbi:hypothetical protein QE152_g9059 [Popillia japonica]|uniref:Uncharacterized protein n=1 Tax=Popillia japonica TaxID=7064 RepID=A0AAW1M182_POPJA